VCSPCGAGLVKNRVQITHTPSISMPNNIVRRPLHSYIKPAIMSYRRVTPVKTGAVSSTLLVPGFRRDDIWIPVPVPDPGSVPAPDLIRGPGQAPIRLSPE